MEKRNIQISLEEAREWYNSGDSFKRELALKAFTEEELSIFDYSDIYTIVHKDKQEYNNITKKVSAYARLTIVATYFNSIYKKEYCKNTKSYFVYEIHKQAEIFYKAYKACPLHYKDFYINKLSKFDTIDSNIYFNSREAAKQAIDILGDELNILFE